MMKRFLLLWVLVGLAAAKPQLCVAQTDEAMTKGAVAASKARTEIQQATNALNNALKRGDAAGALQWLAPNFELGSRQYRVRNLAWMKTALPLQLKSARYTEISFEIGEVERTGDIASATEDFFVKTALKVPKPEGQLSGSGSQGDGRSQWLKTVEGWRLQRGDNWFDSMLFAAAPPAPVAAQHSAVTPDLPATILGLPMQEPMLVLENRDLLSGDSLAFSPDGTALASSYDDRELRLTSLPTGAARAIEAPGVVYEMAYAADGSFWTAQYDGKVRQWNAETGMIKREWTVAPQYQLFHFAVAPDGRNFVVARNSEVQLWNANAQSATLTFPSAAYARVEFSSDNALIAVVSYKGAEIRDARSGALLQNFDKEKWGGFLPDGKTMATWQWNDDRFYTPTRESEGNFLRFRARGNGALLSELAPLDPIRNSPQELEKVRQFRAQPTIGTMDGKLDLAAVMAQPISISGYFELPTPQLSPDGQIAASVYFDGSIGIWKTQTGQIFRVLRGFSSALFGDKPNLVFSPDGQTLAVSSRNGEIAVWNVGLPSPQ